MKKGLLFFCLTATAAGWALDWELPVVTLRAEASGGAAEQDPEEEDLEPTSRRGTVTLTIRESADPLDLAWVVRFSAKDWLAQAGDYAYLDASQEARFAVSKRMKLSALAGAKRMQYPQSGAAWTALHARLGADLAVLQRSSLEVGIDGRWEIHDAAEDSRQRWAGSAAFTTRLRGWQLDARWRGEFRLPLGGPSAVEASSLQTGTVSLRWDPNP